MSIVLTQALPVLSTRTPPSPHEVRGTWHVDTLTRRDGSVSVERVPGGVRVSVGDTGTDDDATRVELLEDGGVRVTSHASPPALLVGEHGARLLPTGTEPDGRAQAHCGDVLVLCSAEALGQLPSGLGGVLAHSPRRLGAHDPDGLLAELMAESDVGAAAVAVLGAEGAGR
ncbi:hypothetical protein [Thalassiella azotivora]